MKKIKPKFNLPKIIKNISEQKSIENFPLRHYSYSTFVKFSTNPIMFKVNYMNGDRIDSTRNISGVIGNAFHNAMEVYYSNKKSGEQEALKLALESGMEFLAEYNDGFIEFSSSTQNKQKAQEIFAYAMQSYAQAKKDEDVDIVACEECIEADVSVEWKGEQVTLPVPLKGYIDKIIRTKDGKIKIVDYKTTRAFSDPEKIDGAKIIQAVQYYFLVYAQYGEAPYSMIFEELKYSKNRDGSSQIREYEIVYEENDMFFDFYFRMYQDMTDAINGKSVFVPNIHSFFDNEVAMIAYIHRLDVPEEQAKLMKQFRVDNITDLLKQKIEHAGSMRKLLKSAEQKFISAKNLNYDKMEIQEKIQTKLMEHGMLIKYDSKVEGHAVDLYRYNPSIGLKMSKISSYSADIEQVTGVSGVRVLAPIPNSSLIGFEIPHGINRTFPDIQPMSEGFNLAMGTDVYGDLVRFDIRKAPHMLVAGATGSGKSVFLNSTIKQLIEIGDVDLHLYDPKMVELSQFKKNAVEYYDDIESIYLSLIEMEKEMNNRYRLLADAGVRNIEEYQGDMRYRVVVIDEFGDLTISGTKDGKTNISKEIQKIILVLAQKARAAGIHMILATQRPSVDIITGSIKANFPTKVAFRMAKATDSLVLLDEAGAENLLGRGDMLFSSDEGMVRLQGLNL